MGAAGASPAVGTSVGGLSLHRDTWYQHWDYAGPGTCRPPGELVGWFEHCLCGCLHAYLPIAELRQPETMCSFAVMRLPHRQPKALQRDTKLSKLNLWV